MKGLRQENVYCVATKKKVVSLLCAQAAAVSNVTLTS
jgi:hypothetical protein